MLTKTNESNNIHVLVQLIHPMRTIIRSKHNYKIHFNGGIGSETAK